MVSARGPQRFAFVFISDGGELAVKSMLLAASLRRHLNHAHEIVCAIPSASVAPSEAALHFFAELQIRVSSVANEVSEHYSIANKIGCLAIPTTADKIVFLDSDILCMDSFAVGPQFDAVFAAKPGDHQTFARDAATWQQAYNAADVPMPLIRFPSTASGEYGPPYFNSGVVGVDVDAGIALSKEWTRCCRAVRASLPLRNGGRSADQISLAIAVQSLQLDYECLHEGYNFPAHLKALPRDRPPVFCHYHWPTVLIRETAARGLVQSLADEHAALRTTMMAAEEWRPLLQPAGQRVDLPPVSSSAPAMTKRKTTPNLIITGIARSGTSLLCNLLHRHSNCVVLNEPEEIFAPLVGEGLPWGIPLFYEQVRADILAGKPIRNKLLNGRITEDTFDAGERSDYQPKVDNSEFVLGTKNTMSYLARLTALRRVMPGAKVIACVRNPFDTIASWKGSFSHLARADMADIPVGHAQDPWLTAREKREVEAIAQTADAAQRRAMWWRHAAERILEQGRAITIVRYHDLIADPQRIVGGILAGFDHGWVDEPLRASAARPARSELDRADRRAISAICSQAAYELGVV